MFSETRQARILGSRIGSKDDRTIGRQARGAFKIGSLTLRISGGCKEILESPHLEFHTGCLEKLEFAENLGSRPKARGDCLGQDLGVLVLGFLPEPQTLKLSPSAINLKPYA